ncbi:MAG: hypothetical protein V4509_00530 [Patescibacteria group bacterium]
MAKQTAEQKLKKLLIEMLEASEDDLYNAVVDKYLPRIRRAVGEMIYE